VKYSGFRIDGCSIWRDGNRDVLEDAKKGRSSMIRHLGENK
jgi:hypothetical protein